MAREVKTVALRLEPEFHGRLKVLARLAGLDVSELVRMAIEAKLDDLAVDPRVQAKIGELQRDIEREADEQRSALAQLLAVPNPALQQLPDSVSPASTTKAAPKRSPSPSRPA